MVKGNNNHSTEKLTSLFTNELTTTCIQIHKKTNIYIGLVQPLEKFKPPTW